MCAGDDDREGAGVKNRRDEVQKLESQMGRAITGNFRTTNLGVVMAESANEVAHKHYMQAVAADGGRRSGLEVAAVAIDGVVLYSSEGALAIGEWWEQSLAGTDAPRAVGMLLAVARTVALPRPAGVEEAEAEVEEQSPVEEECSPEEERNVLSRVCFLSCYCYCCFWVVAVSAPLHH